MKLRSLSFLVLSALSASSLPALGQEGTNALTATEKRQGFKLLFDGRSLDQWRGFNRQELPASGWKVEAGTITMEPVCATCERPGDIITKAEYSSFELRMEWKLSSNANSGVKYLVDESQVKEGHGGLGFEMQILDNQGHPDAKLGVSGNRTAGGLYDLIAPSGDFTRPVGQWNEVRLIVNGAHVEHWLNGKKVVEFERGCQMMKALIAYSKYKDKPRFGETTKGHILLQDHGDRVWFRNIRIKSAPASTSR